MDSLITIATYKRTETACFLKERLQNENLECFFVLAGSIEGKMDHARVQVAAEDVEAAVRIMMEIRSEYGVEIEKIEYQPRMRKIIVPTDFSKDSEHACQFAIHLAQKFEAEIKLLHVYEDPAAELKKHSGETYEHYIMNITREEEQKVKTEMLEFSKNIRSYMKERDINDVFMHSVIAPGDVVRTIKGICKSYQPDMIVLGTVGRKEGSKSVFSGLAKELVNDLGIPVFAIPGSFEEKSFENMKILYATDFNDSDHTSLEQLLRITEAIQKQITCIHIDTAHNPAKEDRIDELNDYLKKEHADLSIKCVLIDYVNVFQGIKDFADNNKMNLLSFTVHRRGIFDMLFMPNLFKKILQESRLPILIFPSII